MPVVASNRIGVEAAPGGEPSIRFYGSSFIAAETGAILAEASRDREEVVTATIDLDAVRHHREDWSFFRDRRPDLYGPLLTLDGGSGRTQAYGGPGRPSGLRHQRRGLTCGAYLRGRRFPNTRVSRNMVTTRMIDPPSPTASQAQLTVG